MPVPDSSGIAAGALEDAIVVPWNDADRVEAALERHRGEVAVIVTEPVMASVGVIPPAPGFLDALREIADRHETLLWLDETVTGFRLAPGGAQERFGVQADLTTFGKALGAGFPVAAICGRADVMDVLTAGRVLHYGTQNANPALLAVVRESIELLTTDGGAAFAHLDRLAGMLVEGLKAALSDAEIPALVQSVGAMSQVFFLLPGHYDVVKIADSREFAMHVDTARFSRFAHQFFDEGVYLSPAAGLHSVLSTVHTDEDVARIVEAVRAALARCS